MLTFFEAKFLDSSLEGDYSLTTAPKGITQAPSCLQLQRHLNFGSYVVENQTDVEGRENEISNQGA